MTSRREFLLATAAAALPAHPPVAPRVDAVPTPFHGHPDGQTTLVRFVVTGVDAPGARLRVFGATGRLLGTAGMVRRGDALVGELWVPLAAPLTLRSDLETPVTRGVHRSSHRLAPTARWTIRWLTLAEPGALRERLARIPPLLLGAEAAALTAAGVRLNPWSAPPSVGRDHLGLLRIAVPAARLGASAGLPLSARALVPDPEEATSFLRAALAGAGVEGIVDDQALRDPATLGLAAGRARMAPVVEAWLAELGRTDGARDGGTVTVIGSDPDFALRALGTIEEWNGLYAFPRVVVEEPTPAVPPDVGPPPSGGAPTSSAGSGFGPSVFHPLVRLAAPADPTLAGLARHCAFPTGGLLVFNPSPFGRSEAVEVPGGGLRLATDIPGMGYALLPGDPPASPRGGAAAPVRERLHAIEAAGFAARLDESTGALASLVEQGESRELVAPGGTFNALDGAVLTDAWIERYDGVGLRLVARRATAGGALTSKVTLIEGLPWVDIENLFDATGVPPGDCHFDLEAEPREVRREVAGGVVVAVPPLDRVPVLRWIALHHGAGPLLFGSATPLAASVSAGGRLTAHGAPGRARFRLARHAGLLPDDPWRFGFGMLPLMTEPAPGRGALPLPTFGRLLEVADPAVAIVGLKDADDGVGLVVYLMDLGGPAREVAVRPGVLGFDGGVLTDLAERDRRPAAAAPQGGVLVPLESGGYGAVRLLRVRVAG